MKERANIKTTIKQAVDYWAERIDECDLSVDWAEADTHSWRCGCQKNLQRCHIIPDSLGGEDSPKNIVLLCARCHAEAPNLNDCEIMWDWIKAYKVPFYETFWSVRGQKEYEFIYKKSIFDELKGIIVKSGDETAVLNRYKQLFGEVTEKAGVHYGQPYFNTATIAGMYRILLRQIAAEFNIKL